MFCKQHGVQRPVLRLQTSNGRTSKREYLRRQRLTTFRPRPWLVALQHPLDQLWLLLKKIGCCLVANGNDQSQKWEVLFSIQYIGVPRSVATLTGVAWKQWEYRLSIQLCTWQIVNPSWNNLLRLSSARLNCRNLQEPALAGTVEIQIWRAWSSWLHGVYHSNNHPSFWLKGVWVYHWSIQLLKITYIQGTSVHFSL